MSEAMNTFFPTGLSALSGIGLLIIALIGLVTGMESVRQKETNDRFVEIGKDTNDRFMEIDKKIEDIHRNYASREDFIRLTVKLEEFSTRTMNALSDLRVGQAQIHSDISNWRSRNAAD